MEFIERVSKIQQELKAPKNQRNNFGGYNYRSCEDILEAVKPLLGGLILTLNDEIIQVGDRVYVKATATITDGDHSVSTTANAREPLAKKGMDESQITGAASSYARKYALNGLFDIDDTKDADATNTHGKEDKASHDTEFSKEAKTWKTANTKAVKQAVANGEEHQPAPSKKTIEERTQLSIDWLNSQTPTTYLNATKGQKDYINNLANELRDTGKAELLDNLMAALDRASSIDDSINY